MRFLCRSVLLVAVCLSGVAVAQTTFSGGKTLIVLPFENASGAPGLTWVAEAFPEILGQRLSSPVLYVLNRDDRMRAYDQIGIPADLHPSRATIYRIAERMGVDYVVLGRYTFDGRTFAATAQLLDMQRQRLSTPVSEAGPLVELIDVQTMLAWDLVRVLRPNLATSKEAFRLQATPVRLDAFENYMLGITAGTPEEKIQKFREAVRLSPGYSQALLQLGRIYYSQRQYEPALLTLQKISRDDPLAREANFFLGLAAYYRGDYGKAKWAFDFLASQLPLTEVYNNLGVVTSRMGEKSSLSYFQRAVQADPNDADYRFNLAVACFQAGNLTEADRQMLQASRLRPSDNEAKSFLASLQSGATSTKLPLPRLKRNYDESSFRQVALGIEAEAEKKLGGDPRPHAQFHVSRGHELLNQGFIVEAEREFREAVLLDNFNAEGHSGLASALEARRDPSAARLEAQAALRIRTFPEPLLVLARLDLSENKTEAASESVDRVLQLEPANGSAVALKRAIADKLAQKAQPLQNP